MNLAEELPRLLPKAVAWAEAESAVALAAGKPLDPAQREIADAAGVRYPERVRIAVVDSIPHPTDSHLREAARQSGLLGPDTVGLALGHAVLLRSDFAHDLDVLAHELRHVRQYECFGSIKAFLSVYLAQVVQFGYEHAPMERTARSDTAARAEECGSVTDAGAQGPPSPRPSRLRQN
jgi:hypothetical protein